MTPRINEASFSETLLAQLKKKNFGYQMDGLGCVSELTHPALIKIQLQFQQAPEELTFRSQVQDYNLLAFENESKARSQYPEVKNYGGFPWQLMQFRSENPTEALIHFGELGSVYLSKSESFAPAFVPALHHYALPVWLDYALSAELWGPAGKWTRFHERLHTLFENNGLLIDQDSPGFYPLKKNAEWLEKEGFKGLKSPTRFALIMTWDFPLTGLIELEKALARGP